MTSTLSSWFTVARKRSHQSPPSRIQATSSPSAQRSSASPGLSSGVGASSLTLSSSESKREESKSPTAESSGRSRSGSVSKKTPSLISQQCCPSSNHPSQSCSTASTIVGSASSGDPQRSPLSASETTAVTALSLPSVPTPGRERRTRSGCMTMVKDGVPSLQLLASPSLTSMNGDPLTPVLHYLSGAVSMADATPAPSLGLSPIAPLDLGNRSNSCTPISQPSLSSMSSVRGMGARLREFPEVDTSLFDFAGTPGSISVSGGTVSSAHGVVLGTPTTMTRRASRKTSFPTVPESSEFVDAGISSMNPTSDFDFGSGLADLVVLTPPHSTSDKGSLSSVTQFCERMDDEDIIMQHLPSLETMTRSECSPSSSIMGIHPRKQSTQPRMTLARKSRFVFGEVSPQISGVEAGPPIGSDPFPVRSADHHCSSVDSSPTPLIVPRVRSADFFSDHRRREAESQSASQSRSSHWHSRSTECSSDLISSTAESAIEREESNDGHSDDEGDGVSCVLPAWLGKTRAVRSTECSSQMSLASNVSSSVMSSEDCTSVSVKRSRSVPFERRDSDLESRWPDHCFVAGKHHPSSTQHQSSHELRSSVKNPESGMDERLGIKRKERRKRKKKKRKKPGRMERRLSSGVQFYFYSDAMMFEDDPRPHRESEAEPSHPGRGRAVRDSDIDDCESSISVSSPSCMSVGYYTPQQRKRRRNLRRMSGGLLYPLNMKQRKRIHCPNYNKQRRRCQSVVSHSSMDHHPTSVADLTSAAVSSSARSVKSTPAVTMLNGPLASEEVSVREDDESMISLMSGSELTTLLSRPDDGTGVKKKKNEHQSEEDEDEKQGLKLSAEEEEDDEEVLSSLSDASISSAESCSDSKKRKISMGCCNSLLSESESNASGLEQQNHASSPRGSNPAQGATETGSNSQSESIVAGGLKSQPKALPAASSSSTSSSSDRKRDGFDSASEGTRQSTDLGLGHLRPTSGNETPIAGNTPEGSRVDFDIDLTIPDKPDPGSQTRKMSDDSRSANSAIGKGVHHRGVTLELVADDTEVEDAEVDDVHHRLTDTSSDYLPTDGRRVKFQRAKSEAVPHSKANDSSSAIGILVNTSAHGFLTDAEFEDSSDVGRQRRLRQMRGGKRTVSDATMVSTFVKGGETIVKMPTDHHHARAPSKHIASPPPGWHAAFMADKDRGGGSARRLNIGISASATSTPVEGLGSAPMFSSTSIGFPEVIGDDSTGPAIVGGAAAMLDRNRSFRRRNVSKRRRGVGAQKRATLTFAVPPSALLAETSETSIDGGPKGRGSLPLTHKSSGFFGEELSAEHAESEVVASPRFSDLLAAHKSRSAATTPNEKSLRMRDRTPELTSLDPSFSVDEIILDSVMESSEHKTDDYTGRVSLGKTPIEDSGTRVLDDHEQPTEFLRSQLMSNHLFSGVDEEHRHKMLTEMINLMIPVFIPKGRVLIKQGDEGDAFYMIEKGTFLIKVTEATYNPEPQRMVIEDRLSSLRGEEEARAIREGLMMDVHDMEFDLEPPMEDEEMEDSDEDDYRRPKPISMFHSDQSEDDDDDESRKRTGTTHEYRLTVEEAVDGLVLPGSLIGDKEETLLTEKEMSSAAVVSLDEPGFNDNPVSSASLKSIPVHHASTSSRSESEMDDRPTPTQTASHSLVRKASRDDYPGPKFILSQETVLVGEAQRGDAVGEYALLYNTPRTATLEAAEDCIVWGITAEEFKSVRTKMAEWDLQRFEKRKQWLSNLPMFAPSKAGGNGLSETQLVNLNYACYAQVFEKDDWILGEDEECDDVFMIYEGRVEIKRELGVDSGSDESDNSDERDNEMQHMFDMLTDEEEMSEESSMPLTGGRTLFARVLSEENKGGLKSSDQAGKFVAGFSMDIDSGDESGGTPGGGMTLPPSLMIGAPKASEDDDVVTIIETDDDAMSGAETTDDGGFRGPLTIGGSGSSTSAASIASGVGGGMFPLSLPSFEEGSSPPPTDSAAAKNFKFGVKPLTMESEDEHESEKPYSPNSSTRTPNSKKGGFGFGIPSSTSAKSTPNSREFPIPLKSRVPSSTGAAGTKPSSKHSTTHSSTGGRRESKQPTLPPIMSLGVPVHDTCEFVGTDVFGREISRSVSEKLHSAKALTRVHILRIKFDDYQCILQQNPTYLSEIDEDAEYDSRGGSIGSSGLDRTGSGGANYDSDGNRIAKYGRASILGLSKTRKGLNSKRFRPRVRFGLDELDTLATIGIGAYGKVKLVRGPSRHGSKVYALKQVHKKIAIHTDQVDHICNEKRVLSTIDSKFCIKLFAVYQDEESIFFLMTVVLGGELFGLLRHNDNFDEYASRFYSACVIEAFEHLHSKDIIYRDLKPENLLIDRNGYLVLTDFGFSKKRNATTTLCGTPEFMAPEVLHGWVQSFGIDWWALGVLLYEMVVGEAPFQDDSHVKMYQKILEYEPVFPPTLSPPCKHLIQQLLTKNAYQRLGSSIKGAAQIKKHPFYLDFDWYKFAELQMEPPYEPNVESDVDIRNFPPCDDEAMPKIFEHYQEDIREVSFDSDDYDWCDEF